MHYNVVLIYLPKPFLRQPDAQVPLGLMYLASSLEKHGKSVVIKNYASHSDDEAISDLPEADLYGITATSLEVLQANRFAERLKRRYPAAKVALGGPGTYAMEFIDKKTIEMICVGEGEYTILRMLEDAQQNKHKQLYVGQEVKDLDLLPLPARHLLKDKQGGNIFAYNHNYVDGGSTVIISSRGCPYQCAFCSAPALTHNNTLRYRSPSAVAAEMRYVIETYNIRQFRFSDDMFTASHQRVLDLCEAIGPLNAVWRISCRVKPLNEEILKAMWDAGCRELSFGIESFDDEVLAGLRKKATRKDNVHALEMSAKLGYKTRMLFMIRTPYQTPKTIERNKFWISKVPFTIMACTAFIPIPGCDIWYDPASYGIEILDRDLDKYNFYMFGPDGRRPLDPIIKIIDRPLDEFMKESEDFRDWVEDFNKVNRG